jgi:DNA-binding CsgD family transcriptional regulator
MSSQTIQYSTMLSIPGALALGATPALVRLARKLRWPVPPPKALFLVTLEPLSIAQNLRDRLKEFHLTPKETEIALLAAQGHPGKTLADLCGIKLATLKEYLGEIYRKTGTTSRATLLAKLFNLGPELMADSSAD